MSFDQHNVIKVILVLTGPTWVQLYYNWTQVGPVVGLALMKKKSTGNQPKKKKLNF